VNQRPLGCLFEVVETLVLTVIIFLVIQNFVAQPYRVEQQSMEQTLQRDQYVLVDKLTPRFNPYARGDIVVFTPPSEVDGSGTPFIKRVIGVPGDRITLREGTVMVNGHEIEEPYVRGQPTEPFEQPEFEVAPDTLFVMGDNRPNSTDSRSFGSVSTGNVIGRAWLRYWPLATLTILGKPDYGDLAPAAAPGSPDTSPAAWRAPRGTVYRALPRAA
jgi:signal peptidase I